MNDKKTYRIANANIRIWARIIDTLICMCIIIPIDILILLTDKNQFNNDGFSTWRYLLVALCLIIVDFLYFIIIPFFTKKGTLGLMLFHYRIYNVKGNLFINLSKKELFAWIIPSFILLIISIICSTQNGVNALKLINSITLFTWTWSLNWITIVSSIFNVMLVFSCLAIFVIFVNTIIKSKNKTMIDYFSNTVIISNKPIYQNIVNKSKEKNFPGILNDEDLERIKDL